MHGYYEESVGEPDVEPEPRKTRFVFYRMGEAKAETWEQVLPGSSFNCQWLDNDTIVFLTDVSEPTASYYGPVKNVLVRMNVTTGELFRLYPEPGPIVPEDLKPDMSDATPL